MKTKLIEALRAAANTVEATPSIYFWKYANTCACGIVAQHMLGISPEKLREMIPITICRAVTYAIQECPQ